MSSTSPRQPRWRQLAQDPKLRKALHSRQTTLNGIRQFFTNQEFQEVETPLLVAHPGTEPYLDVFQTTLTIADGRELTGYLLTSPEYAMKKLLVAGLPRIFQLCKSFRNGEGLGGFHNHEFTILEWYRTPADYTDLMTDCEELIRYLAQLHTNQSQTLKYQGRQFDISGNWPRLTVAQLLNEHAGVDPTQLLNLDHLADVCQQQHFPSAAATTWDDYFTLLFMNCVEPVLATYTTPVFVVDYPLPQAALAKRSKNNPEVAERVELYIGGLELANGFSELTDAQEQERRFREELQLRDLLGKTKYYLDEDFIAALQAGMPESAGMALGVDRLAMLFADAPTIKDVLYFPIESVFPL